MQPEIKYLSTVELERSRYLVIQGASSLDYNQPGSFRHGRFPIPVDHVLYGLVCTQFKSTLQTVSTTTKNPAVQPKNFYSNTKSHFSVHVGLNVKRYLYITSSYSFVFRSHKPFPVQVLFIHVSQTGLQWTTSCITYRSVYMPK
jgi:hypothetical protein